MIDIRKARRAMRCLVVAATLLTAAFAAAAGAADETAGIPASALEQRSSCWVLVDMDSFFCGTCLDHLLAFSRAVPARVQEERVRGILVFGGAATPEETRRKAQVVQTKWQGQRHPLSGLRRRGHGVLRSPEGGRRPPRLRCAGANGAPLPSAGPAGRA
jgi:hypothetical protein